MDTLLGIEEEMLVYETKIGDVLETLGNTESPDIVCDNLSLIIALLANSRSHLHNKVKQLKTISNLNYAEISKKRAVVCLESIKLSREEVAHDVKVEVADDNDHLINEIVDNDIDVNLVKVESFESNIDPLNGEAGNSLDDFNATNTEDSNQPLPVIKKVRVRNRYGQLKCEICEKVLYKKREFNKHLATHKINSTPSCKSCGETLIPPYNKQRLICKNCLKIRRDSSFKCELCRMTCRTEQDLQNHLNNFDHEKCKCPKCGKQFQLYRLMERHLKAVHEKLKPYVCDICGKAFPNLPYVNIHKKYVHEGQNYDYLECKICNKILLDKYKLTRHMKIEHEMDQKVPCDQCGKLLRNNLVLSKHAKMAHDDERPFSCTVCEKKFKKQRYMKEHFLNSHSSDKQYPCSVCDMILPYPLNLRQHYKVVHKWGRMEIGKAMKIFFRQSADSSVYFKSFTEMKHDESHDSKINHHIID